jgi:hypothetical protein
MNIITIVTENHLHRIIIKEIENNGHFEGEV